MSSRSSKRKSSDASLKAEEVESKEESLDNQGLSEYELLRLANIRRLIRINIITCIYLHYPSLLS